MIEVSLSGLKLHHKHNALHVWIHLEEEHEVSTPKIKLLREDLLTLVIHLASMTAESMHKGASVNIPQANREID